MESDSPALLGDINQCLETFWLLKHGGGEEGIATCIFWGGAGIL
jgi:hypothetical protein